MESAARPARILIVDDVADNREVLARRFQRRGYEILQADGGLRALEIIAAGGLDLVLLDVVMPDVSGLDVLRQVRETLSLIQLPVILVTAQAESQSVVEGLELGANDYITKPVDFPVALARAETQIGRRQAELALVEANDLLQQKVAELQDALRKAEAANDAKAAFLANMNHEVRTPLNGVLGISAVLAGTTLDAYQRELVGIVTSSGAALERVLSNVLDIAMAESDTLEIRPVSTDLGALVGSVAESIEPLAAAKGLDFAVSLSPEAEGSVRVDPVRLTQILSNLLFNGVKFTADGRVTLTADRSGDEVRFTVRDTGIGFSAEVKDQIFRPFEQADGSATRRFGGSGLGLPIARRLAELMGGALDAHAEPGQGATFVLTLPLKPDAERLAA